MDDSRRLAAISRRALDRVDAARSHMDDADALYAQALAELEVRIASEHCLIGRQMSCG